MSLRPSRHTVLRVLQKVKTFVKRPTIQLLSAVILLISALSQVYDDLNSDRAMHLGVHHGLILMALVQILSVLPDFIEAMERWIKSWDDRLGIPNDE